MALVVFVLAIIIAACFGLVAFRGAPYVPTRRRQVNQALDELYQVGEGDVVVDLGSGDGVFLRAAAKKGAQAVGYELNPILWLISKMISRRDPKVSVRLADFWREPLPEQTTLVYIFIDGRDVKKIEKLLAAHVRRTKKSLFVISYAFSLFDTKPKKTVGPMQLYELKA